MRRHGPLLALFLFVFFVVLIGCGGSGGGGGQVVGTTASTDTGGDTGGLTDGGGGGVVGNGRVLVVIDWPAFTREIPDYAKSVLLQITLPGTTTPIATKYLDRTSNDPYAQSVEFLEIPAGDVVLECRAMTEAQGKGEVVGKFLTSLKVVTNGETSLLATIDGTVESVHASNPPDTLEVGKGVMLLAQGVDEDGKTLMLPGQAIKWTMVSGSEYAELLSGGSLVGLAQGECVIRVTETSSGDTDEFTVKIIPSSSTTGGSGGSTGGTTGGGGSPNLTGAKFALIRHDLGQASSLYVEDVMSGSTFEVINTSSPLLRDPGDVPGESLIIQNARITEDGQTIIFLRYHFDGLNGSRNWDIYSVGTNGTNLKKIKADRELWFVNKPGTAFITKDPFSSNVFLMFANGSETLIPHPGTPVPYVDWSEDGGSLLTKRFSVFNSRRVAVPSGQVVQTYGFSSAPPYRFNKGLTKLLAFGQGSSNNFVEIIDVATGSVTLLDTWAEDRFFIGDVNFTPDQKGVIRYQSTGSHLQLYVVGMDGSKNLLRQDAFPVPLSTEWAPARYLWQPGFGSRP